MSNLIKSNAVARLLSVTMHTIRDMRRDGLLPLPVVVGKSELWVDAEIESWLKCKLAEREGCNMDVVNDLPWPPVLLSGRQVASIFKVMDDTVLVLAKAGKLPGAIIIAKKNSYRWVKSEVYDLIKKLLLERGCANEIPSEPVLIGANEVAIKLGFTNSGYISALSKKGVLPKPITIGGKLLFWVESEIQEYADSKIAERDAAVDGGAE